MRASELCPPPHLEAADFSQDTEVTIKSFAFKEVGQEKATKGVVYFKEMPRGMVINRTNLKRIIRQHGNETDLWIGKKITLYPSETDFGGNTVPCIRVKDTVPAPPLPPYDPLSITDEDIARVRRNACGDPDDDELADEMEKDRAEARKKLEESTKA